MPRFAANLSMNPIEPLKPTSSQSSTIKSSTEVQSSMLHTTKEVVPEAEFDWNSSGLVNPLDGELQFFVSLFSVAGFLFLSSRLLFK